MHININGTKIFFEVYGNKISRNNKKVIEKPTFIFLHGGSCLDHTPYIDFWSRFSDVAQIIFIDHRGCGRSDLSTPDTWNLEQWGRDVYDFCNALNINKPIVGGISFGGYIALSYLNQFPDHPLGIIITDTEAHVSKEQYLNKINERAITLGKDPQPLVEIAKKIFSDEFSLDLFLPYIEILRMFGNPVTPIDDFSYVKTLSLEPTFSFNRQIFNFDYRQKLKNMQCRMLYLAADDAPLHSLENAKELVAVYPKDKMQFEVFPNSSSPVYEHDIPRAEQLIRNFIQSCSSS